MDVRLRNMTALYLEKNGRFLLLFRQGGRVVNNVWCASAGGHFEEGELNDPRACVLREMKEELGLTEDSLKNLEMRYVTVRFVKGEIRQNYYFFAGLRDSVNENLTSNEGILKWYTPDELAELEMPFTAKFVLEHYLKTGRNNNIIYGGAADSAGVNFTPLADPDEI